MPALVLEIEAGDPSLQAHLQDHQQREHDGEGEREPRVDLDAEHDRVEHHPEEQLELRFDLVHQVEDVVERGAGEERLGAFARRLVLQELGLVAVLAGEAQHVAAVAAEPGALGEHPAHRAGDIGCRLGGEDPDQVRHQELVVGDVAAGLDDEIGGRRREQRLGHHQHAHDVERRADEPLEELQASDRLAGHGALESFESVRAGRRILLQILARFRAGFATKNDGNSVGLRRRLPVSK